MIEPFSIKQNNVKTLAGLGLLVPNNVQFVAGNISSLNFFALNFMQYID